MNRMILNTHLGSFKFVYNVDVKYIYLLTLYLIWNLEYLESNFLKSVVE
jgi:hypothetical protein